MPFGFGSSGSKPIGRVRQNKNARIAELEMALRSVLDMYINEYACYAARNIAFDEARKVLDKAGNYIFDGTGGT